MDYWYERNTCGKWVFCYKLSNAEQKIIDAVMVDAIKEFKGNTKEDHILATCEALASRKKINNG